MDYTSQYVEIRELRGGPYLSILGSVLNRSPSVAMTRTSVRLLAVAVQPMLDVGAPLSGRMRMSPEPGLRHGTSRA